MDKNRQPVGIVRTATTANDSKCKLLIETLSLSAANCKLDP